ncbi:MAG: hypothetical protein U5J82_05280 [Desulfobacterales bacterium]|nr:hypothetical protein [Desulfobacterales bacterium]
MVFLAAPPPLRPLRTAVSTATETLSLGKGDPRLLLMTDAPYVRVDGLKRPALPGDRPGPHRLQRGSRQPALLPAPPVRPLRFMLFHKTSGEAVTTSPGAGLVGPESQPGPATISQPAFWERTGDYQAGQDLSTLAAIASMLGPGWPYDFLKSAELHNHICPGLTSCT